MKFLKCYYTPIEPVQLFWMLPVGIPVSPAMTEAVTAEVVPQVMPELKPGEKPKELTKLKVKFTVAGDALPGVREFRLATPNGMSTVGQLVVVRDPVIVELDGNEFVPETSVVSPIRTKLDEILVSLG